MKKIYLCVIIPLVLGIGCFIAFESIGSHVSEDGTLIEPFGLIPIGYLMFATSLIASLIIGIKTLLKKK